MAVSGGRAEDPRVSCGHVRREGGVTAEPGDSMHPPLPVAVFAQPSLKGIYLASLAIAAGASLVSLWGLGAGSIYPSQEFREAFVPNDAATLLVGVPLLVGSMWLAWRGWLLGLLVWPGALLYMLYNFLAYALAMPVGLPILVHLCLVSASLYAILGLLSGIDARAVQRRLVGAVSERLAGAVLIALGLLFLTSVLGAIGAAVLNETAIPEIELAVHTADFLIAPAWVIAGTLLVRRSAIGYVAGLGLLIQGSMLFVALALLILLQPGLTSVPLMLGDLVVVLAMGLVCFVPTGLFIRGVVRESTRGSS